MRSVTTLEAGALEAPVVDIRAEVKIWHNRLLVGEFSGTRLALLSESGDGVFPQSVSGNDTIVELVKSPTGEILLYLPEFEKRVSTGLVANNACKPGVLAGENTADVYYHNGTEWRRAEISLANIIADSGDVVLGDSSLGLTIPSGAVYPFPQGQAFIVYDKGGYRAYYRSSVGNVMVSPLRFFDPRKKVAEQPFATAAIYKAGKVYFYASMPDGSVKGIILTIRGSERYTFSDPFMAVPSDLSFCDVFGGFEHEGKIFLAARFRRTKELSGLATYIFLLPSLDGRSFAFVGEAAVSRSSRQMLFVPKNGSVFVLSNGQKFVGEIPWYVSEAHAPSVTTSAISVGGNSQTVTVEMQNSVQKSFLRYGNVAALYFSSVGGQKTLYMKYAITRVSRTVADGEAAWEVELTHYGMWRVGQLRYGQYVEKQGREVLADDLKQLEALHKMSGGDDVLWSFSVDFWKDGKANPLIHNTAPWQLQYVETDDLKKLFAEYPKIVAGQTYTIRVFGWSRAGRPDTNPNTPDPTPTSVQNATVTPILTLKDEAGEFVINPTLQSPYASFPQEYFVTRPGSLPVEYSFVAPKSGELVKVTVRVNSRDGETLSYIERVEIPNLPARYLTPEVTDASFSNPQKGERWTLKETIDIPQTLDQVAVETSFRSSIDKAYAIVIGGQARYQSASNQVLLDPLWIIKVSPSAPAPAWEGEYPASQSHAWNGIVVFGSKDPWHPDHVQISNTHLPETFSPKHTYLLKFDMGGTMNDSSIPSNEVPFVFGSGEKLRLRLTLPEAATSIQEWTLRVAIFESPKNVYDWDISAGWFGNGNTTFEVHGDYYRMLFYFTPEKGFTQFSSERIGFPNFYDFATIHLKSFAPSSAPCRLHIKVSMSGVTSPPGSSQRAVISYPGGVQVSEVVSGAFEITDERIVELSDGVLWGVTTGFDVFGGDLPFADWSSVRRKFEARIVEAGERYVPVPPGFGVSISDGVLQYTTDIITAPPKSKKKGSPDFLIANKPYSPDDFEVSARFQVRGKSTMAAVVGYFSSKDDYIKGYYKNGSLAVGLVRGGKTTVVASTPAGVWNDVAVFDLRMRFLGGRVILQKKKPENGWGDADETLVYEWDADAVGCPAIDGLAHVGVMSLILPPRFRTTGFVSSAGIIPVAPLDRDENGQQGFRSIANFPESGKVEIGGIVYAYKQKAALLTDDQIRGPFELRNISEWDAFHSKDLDDGTQFKGGKAIEFTMFAWRPAAATKNDYSGQPIATNAGYAWLNEETMYRPFITTDKQIVRLRNRLRAYSEKIPAEYYPSADKVWITNALLWTSKPNPDEIVYHPEGSFVYLHSNDYCQVLRFQAFSFAPDQSVKSLLRDFGAMALTAMEFPDDFSNASVALGTGWTIVR